MGIEPTEDPCEPYAGFEDQGHHQAPVTSALFSILLSYREGFRERMIVAQGSIIISANAPWWNSLW
jgi:hypothetical protein